MILTRKYIDSLEETYKEQQADIQDRLQRVRAGASFGEQSNDCDTYYPAELIQVLDEETGLIEYKELGTEKHRRVYITDLHIE